ncbi:MAG: acyl-CoA dehydrogenase family protein [Antricoccus sp.]
MDFDDTPEEAQYRTRVREYLKDHRDDLVSGGRYGDATKQDMQHSQAVLFDGGFMGIGWPKEFGGQGGTPIQQAIVSQESARAGVAGPINSIGMGMCGPTVIAHGSAEQHERYLKRLLRADDVWCQLFSEPASGSDLAALRTSAVREADGNWRINGQKVWTTGAQFSDYGIVLTRTDPSMPKHKGLTMFVVDMHAPGVTVRPLKQMSGRSQFNEVYFDDVIIDDAERLGEVNDGWRVALTTLMNERVNVGGGGSDLGIGLDVLAGELKRRMGDLPESRKVLYKQDLGKVVVDTLATRYTGFRVLSKISKGEAPGPEASAGKLSGTRAAKNGADLGVRMQGNDGLFASATDGADFQQTQAQLPGLAIAGGTNEVLRNIIGERVLGLPPDMRNDKAKPFSEGVRS